VRATRSGASLDHAWNAGFIAISDPGTVGAVGIIANLTSSTSLAVTADAAMAAPSLAIMACYDNNGAEAITHPTGTTELIDQNNGVAGESFDVAKKEGSPSTANTFTGLTAGVFGRAGIVVEVVTAATTTFVRPTIVVPTVAVSRAASW
jgi:hypothetical protein